MNNLDYYCIRGLDRTKVRLSKFSIVERPLKAGWHAGRKFIGTISLIIALKDSKKFNIAAEDKKLKTVN